MAFLPVQTIVLATRNAHKAAEIRAILGHRLPLSYAQRVPHRAGGRRGRADLAGNATKKAVELARWIGRTGKSGKGHAARFCPG